ncbi:hypothetical protein [Pseudomonas sp. R5(2019)]|uniref:hypothetical protein n=1 Tax=Pseudomonas sp. R5(2019) TaxID=2697566 RepID=UPI001412298F|nr:hypothetical protein [Pseudomonas sp. R5(2019)]NBA94332.1 hypothetical protein [Pseudomonas sp. R5(2019)]
MTDQIPPFEKPCKPSIMLINPDASVPELLAFADTRFRSAKELMISLSCLNTAAMESRDISAVADVAYLLLQDGCDVLDEVRSR